MPSGRDPLDVVVERARYLGVTRLTEDAIYELATALQREDLTDGKGQPGRGMTAVDAALRDLDRLVNCG